mmetsp:Transcript_26303/g.40472  ORF Transcript_26303/g.40472 Transcript_26303/m.40472 type:complete len:371 (+) Transcript_26303:98-1210(+)
MMCWKIQAQTIISRRLCFLVLIGNVLLVAQANIPTGPHSGNKSNTYSTNNDEEDIPIISDQFQHRRSNNERRRSGRSNSVDDSRRSRTRRRRHEDNGGSESDVDDDIPSFSFFSDDEYDDMGYERERIRQRRSRSRKRRNQYTQDDDQSKVMFGLGAHIDSLRSWTESKTGVRIPRINIHCDPVTILKIRKAWSVPGVIFRVGADFETYRLSGGYWRFRACCEDKLIHGRFTIKEVQSNDDEDDNDVLIEYSKSWMFANTVGAATRFNLCAAYSLMQKSGGVRFGIRTENNAGAIGRVTSSPFNGNQRFSVIPVLKLDEEERLKVEVKTNVDVPNPELVLGMDLEGRSGSVGIAGSIDIEVEELNLIANF